MNLSYPEDFIDFFYKEKIDRHKYLDSTRNIVKITFDYNTDMRSVNDLLKTTLSEFKTELNTNNAAIEKKDSNIAISLSKYLQLANRHEQLSREVDTINAEIKAINQPIHADMEISYVINEEKKSFQIGNFRTQKQLLLEAFKTVDSIGEAMDKSNEFIRGIELAFNSLYTPSRILINLFENWIITYKYCFQGVVSNDLRNKLREENQQADLMNINFIASGLVDNIPTFYLEMDILTNKVTYNSLIAVPYFGISLDNHYYFNTETEKTAKFITEDETQLGLNEAIKFCLKQINENKVEFIIQYCPFVRNDKLFQATNDGVLLFNHDPKISKAFVLGTQKDLNESNYPIHVSFNGRLEFNLPQKGDVVIVRENEFNVMSSSLTRSQRQLLANKVNETRNNIEHSTVVKNISNYFKNSYYQIIINVFAFLSITLLAIGSKELYEKLRARSRPRHSSKKLIINRIETIPLKSRRTYRS